MCISENLIIQHNVQLAEYSTMGVPAIARNFILLDDVKKIPKMLNNIKLKGEEFLILGGGSNILFVDDFEGTIIKNELLGIKIIHESDDEVTLEIGAGESWHKLVAHCVENKWFGIENLALIPGTVGAAPIQNIGAYGSELNDVFISLEAYDIQKNKLRVFHKEDCKFEYRESIFKRDLKNKAIITSVTIRLKKNGVLNTEYEALNAHLKNKGINSPTIKDVFEAVVEVRKSKLPNPDEIGNNGSFFKNPVIKVSKYKDLKQSYPNMPCYPLTDQFVKIPAGWLIDKAGWKGFRSGDAGVHAKQALVLVNYGAATGKELSELSDRIQQDIKTKYGISLVREVNVIKT